MKSWLARHLGREAAIAWWILMALFAGIVVGTVVWMVVRHDGSALAGVINLVIFVPVLVREWRHRDDMADVARGP